MTSPRVALRALALPALLLGACAKAGDPVTAGAVEAKQIAQQAYVYAFPIIAGYKAMNQFSVDKNSGQYKSPFNVIWNDSKVFTPADKAIVTPNSDTPYSLLEMDLRAEPLVLCVPAVEKGRYYSVQIVDMYSFNVGYIGSRATGNDAGCYMVAGPTYKGATPTRIKQVFPLETEFGIAIYRTQLFSATDMAKVQEVQAGYRVQTLSAFTKQPAPAAMPLPNFPAFTDSAFKTEFIRYANFLLKFAPTVPAEQELRAQFATVGVAPGAPFDFSMLSDEHKAAVGLGIKEGYDAIDKQRNEIGKSVNGWRVGAAFGDRAFYKGDYTLRAAAALAGIYGNDAQEAMYPLAKNDSAGEPLDGSKHDYTLTFAGGQYPPVNAFWSVTMYDGKTQLLIENPINRYLINAPMLPGLKKNKDGGVTFYIQAKSPGKALESNWLPAPSGPIYMVMRLYWPKEDALSGKWEPPPVRAAK